MKEIVFEGDKGSQAATFAACLATILELPVSQVPRGGLTRTRRQAGRSLAGWPAWAWVWRR